MLQLKLQSAKEGKYCFCYGPGNFKEIKFITPETSISRIKLGVNKAWLLHDKIRVACILEKSVGLTFIPRTQMNNIA